jgi:GTPase SAR1 family protein
MIKNNKLENQTIILDGQKGVGKSNFLLQIIYHYFLVNQDQTKEKLILFYIPNLSSWTSGKYEYESTEKMTFKQPSLAVKVLKNFYFLNSHILAKMPSPVSEYKNLAAFTKAGSENVLVAHSTLMKIIDILTNDGFVYVFILLLIYLFIIVAQKYYL